MLRDDLALLKMAWLNQAMSRYETLEEVARDAARILPLLQSEFTSETLRLNPLMEGLISSPPPSQQAGHGTPGQRLTQ